MNTYSRNKWQNLRLLLNNSKVSLVLAEFSEKVPMNNTDDRNDVSVIKEKDLHR